MSGETGSQGARRCLIPTKGTMRKIVVIMVAVAALLVAAQASAHGLIAHHGPHASAVRIEQSQKANLKHARFLCHYGRNKTRRWGCAAVKWLTRELHETEALLRPRPTDEGAWSCIHRYEGAWTSNTGNGYFGGLQMDWSFMRLYGSQYVRRWGTADNWPVWAQLDAARRARDSGRGYGPWPNTARACGLL